METQIAELVLKNGLSMVLMALIVMALVGFVKIFTKGIINKKVVSETKQKWFAKLYLLLSLVFSFILVMLYYALITHEDVWSIACLRDSGIVWTLTSPLYQLYKQFGGRNLLITICTLIYNKFKGKNSNVDDILSIVLNILSEDAPLLTDSQIEAIKTNLSNELSGNKNNTTTENKEITEETKETKVE